MTIHENIFNENDFLDIFHGPIEGKIISIQENIHRVLQQAKSILVFGAGKNGKNIVQTLSKKQLPMQGFIDEITENQNKIIHTLPVYSLEEAGKCYLDHVVVIVSIFNPTHSFQQTKLKLEKYGWQVLSIFQLAFLYSDDFLPFYYLGKPDCVFQNQSSYCQLYHTLIDDRSRQELMAHLQLRLFMDFSDLPKPIGCDFSYVQASLQHDVIFVDAGAYNGDTVQAFLKMAEHRFDHIVAYEPDVTNFEQLSAYHQTLPSAIRNKIYIVNKGIWSTRGTLGFTETATPGSAFTIGATHQVPAVALDDEMPLVKNRFIKLDVEGAEIAALEGAKQLIQNGHTIFSIAVYHRPDDLWQIPTLILQYNPRYVFGLRSHGYDGADLMLYAFPKAQ
jgi:FkbM family methyltransferase